MSHVGAGRPLLERVRLGVAFLGEGRRTALDLLWNHWYATEHLAAELGLGPAIRDSVYQTFERWDGKGVPGGARGDQLLIASRLVNLADVVEVYHASGRRRGGNRRRSGAQRYPVRSGRWWRSSARTAPMLFSDLDSAATTWEAVIAAEPSLEVVLSDDRAGRALEAIADFTDVKSPYTLGHSRGVADLAGGRRS